MKKTLILALLLFAAHFGNAQEKKTNPEYDAELAKQYGADDYGMKMYVLVILKTGSNTTATKAQTDSAFAGHMANMNRLVKENKLIVAGPLSKNNQTYRGIFILNTKSIDEAKQMLATDPAYQAKLLDADLFNWYGSAALPAYLKTEGQLGKYKF
ncbi:MAG: YciI family protein [Pedobacter sp.]|nr:YciI family protein [Pedobacter sp.]MDQ8053712.1 YciI family protein [Pedobacter sp.]